MQFKNPEIAYFLLLLLIPILVHLFQLRKFKKEYFTNVAILKQLSVQTRKSSKLKKWLLLLTRLLLLFFLIMAFAQPFFLSKDSKNSSNELFVVLDNSYSMQSRGDKGELLKRAVEDLISAIPDNKNFSVFTCDNNFFDTNIKSVQKDLQSLEYSSNTFEIDQIMASINARKTAFGKDVLVVTDGVGMTAKQLAAIDLKQNLSFVIPRTQQQNNVAVDTVYIEKTVDNFYEIAVKIVGHGNDFKPVSVALFNNDKLIAKTIVSLDKNVKIQSFTIPKADFHGYVSIQDNGLDFDNTYYFNIVQPPKTNLISIGSVDKMGFLQKIFTQDEFIYNNIDLKLLNYNIIEKQDAILLNELSDISQSLQVTLKNFVDKGGILIVIPAVNQNLISMNTFLSNFGKFQFTDLENSAKQITKIVFEHPLYKDVFEKKTATFQYPTVNSSFHVQTSGATILGFADQRPFLVSVAVKNSKVYVFSAAVNKENSNFQNSPLIVPSFYKMGKHNIDNVLSSFQIGRKNTIFADVTLAKDEILELRNKQERFMPLQQMMNQKVKITFLDLPRNAGNFGVYNKSTLVKNISFNYDRTEGKLREADSKVLSDIKISTSINSYFETLDFDRTDNQLWKWFAILALIFLIIEIFIQKFVK